MSNHVEHLAYYNEEDFLEDSFTVYDELWNWIDGGVKFVEPGTLWDEDSCVEIPEDSLSSGHDAIGDDTTLRSTSISDTRAPDELSKEAV